LLIISKSYSLVLWNKTLIKSIIHLVLILLYNLILRITHILTPIYHWINIPSIRIPYKIVLSIILSHRIKIIPGFIHYLILLLNIPSIILQGSEARSQIGVYFYHITCYSILDRSAHQIALILSRESFPIATLNINFLIIIPFDRSKIHLDRIRTYIFKIVLPCSKLFDLLIHFNFLPLNIES